MGYVEADHDVAAVEPIAREVMTCTDRGGSSDRSNAPATRYLWGIYGDPLLSCVSSIPP